VVVLPWLASRMKATHPSALSVIISALRR
jgi:hypothetical protein